MLSFSAGCRPRGDQADSWTPPRLYDDERTPEHVGGESYEPLLVGIVVGNGDGHFVVESRGSVSVLREVEPSLLRIPLDLQEGLVYAQLYTRHNKFKFLYQSSTPANTVLQPAGDQPGVMPGRSVAGG